MRTPLLAANWKMHKTAAEAREFIAALEVGRRQIHGDAGILIFPSHPLIVPCMDALQAASARGIELGGQDLHPDREGAHTGDTSAEQLADAGCDWALCGHSERRQDHGEDDALVARKVAAARRAGLRPLLCVGESLEERESGATEQVLAKQLGAAVLVLEGLDRLVLAYEPVWAIGTGRTATTEIAQQAHSFLRGFLREHLGGRVADEAILLYGGSVKPENCEELLAATDVDGFLIGGAGLDPDSFLDIIRRCAR